MKKSIKSFIAASLAGVMFLSSTLGTFASNFPTYEEGDKKRVIVNFLHGGTDDYNAGYNFANSGLTPSTGIGPIAAGNIVKMSVIDDEHKDCSSDPGAGGEGEEATGQIAYCVAPSEGISTGVYWDSASGFLADVTDLYGVCKYLKEGTETANSIYNNLSLALSCGLTGTVYYVWQENAWHGQYEWVESSVGTPIDELNVAFTSSMNRNTASRIATQLIIWNIVCGWYDDSTAAIKGDENTALNYFLANFKADEKTDVINVYSYIKTNMVTLAGKTAWVYELMNRYDNTQSSSLQFTKDNPDASYAHFTINFDGAFDMVPEKAQYEFANSIFEGIESLGLKKPENEPAKYTKTELQDFFNKNENSSAYLTREKNGNYTIYIPAAKASEFKGNKTRFSFNLENVVKAADSSIDKFLGAVGLTHPSEQEAIVPRPFTFDFGIDLEEKETPPTGLKKTFDGQEEVDPSYYEQCEFIIVDKNELAYVIATSDIDENGYTVYTFTDRNTRVSDNATKFVPSSDGCIHFADNVFLDNLENYQIVELSAPVGYQKNIGDNFEASELEKDDEGYIIFNNEADGTGILYLEKWFVDIDGRTRLTAKSEKEYGKAYKAGINLSRFKIKNADTGDYIGATMKEKGIYEYTGTGSTEFILAEDGSLAVDKIPTGVYVVEETTVAPDFWNRSWSDDYVPSCEVTAVSVDTVNTTLEERIKQAKSNSTENLFKNIYQPWWCNIKIEKDSETRVVEGFEFTIKSDKPVVHKGSEVAVYEETIATDKNGEILFEEIPAYDEDGNYATYTIHEERTNVYYRLCADQSVTVTPGKTEKAKFYNYINTTAVGVIKYCEDDEVNGIDFTITGTDPAGIDPTKEYTLTVYRQRNQSTGEIVGYGELDGLPVYNTEGSAQIVYEVKEETPRRYKTQFPVNIAIAVNEEFEPKLAVTQVEFENELKRADYQFVKWCDDILNTVGNNGDMSGFKFLIESENSDYSQIAESDANGLVVFKDLPVYDKNDQLIKYSIVEIDVPDRYMLPEAITGITLNENNLKNVLSKPFNNVTKKAALVLTKKNEAGATLSGAAFRLYEASEYDEMGESASVIATKKTKSDGKVTFNDLAFNKEYVLVEYMAPKGYAKLTDPIRFTITEETATEINNEYYYYLDCVNTQPAKIVVTKKDDKTGKGLAGATFKLIQLDANGNEKTVIVEKKNTGLNGKVEFDNLSAGKYKLVEVSAPYGYALPKNNETIIDVPVFASGEEAVVEIEIENEGSSNKLSVMKVDSDNVPLKGAVFTLYRITDLGGRVAVATATSNDYGIAVFNGVSSGNYEIEETKAPSGYVKTTEVFPVTVVEGQEEFVPIIIENTPTPLPSIDIKKTDLDTGKVLSSAEFALIDDKTKNVIASATTDKNGIASFTDLKYDNAYWIAETKAPVDEDGNEYELLEEDIFVYISDGETHYNFTTNCTSNLVDNYDNVSISKEYNGETRPLALVVNVKNYKDKSEYGSLKIVKTAEDDVIESVIFSVKTTLSTGKVISGTYATDANGVIVINNLLTTDPATGEKLVYEISEVGTPSRYFELPIENAELKTDDTTTVEFENKLVDEDVGGIEVTKTADDGKIEGITFYVKGSDGNTYTMTTGSNGYASLDNLPIYDSKNNFISYEISEEELEGYVPIAPVAVERLYKDENVPVPFHNSKEYNEIRLIKVDDSNKPLEGATFSLYKNAGCTQFVASAVSAIDMNEESSTKGKSVVVFSTGITSNTTYYLRETEAPKGYNIKDTIYECVIDANNKTSYRIYNSGADLSEKFPVCVNSEAEYSAKVIKTDGTKALEGAKFGLYEDEACTVKLAEATSKIDTDTNSDTYNMAVVSFAVDVGVTRYIKEISAPSGYELSEKVFRCTVDDKGRVLYRVVGTDADFTTYPTAVNKAKVVTTVTTVPNTTTTPIETTTNRLITTTPTGTSGSGITSSVTTTSRVTTTTVPEKITTVVTTSPSEEKTTTTTTTTKPPVTTTNKTDTPKKPKDDNPETGVSLNITGLVAMAVISGVACAASALKGVSGRKKEQDK